MHVPGTCLWIAAALVNINMSEGSKKKCAGDSCCLCSVKFNGRKHTHTDRFSSNLRNFLGTSEDLEIENRQCVCRACEVSAKDCMKKNHNGEAYRLRWRVQIDRCSVPACSIDADIRRHAFSWRDICDSRGQQKVILAGCFSGDAEDQAWSITSYSREPMPIFNCNSEEADTRMLCEVKVHGN